MELDIKAKITLELMNREFASAEEKKMIDKRVSDYMSQIRDMSGSSK